jgi:hypothetical protein
VSDESQAIEPTSVQTGAEVDAATGSSLPAAQEQAPERWTWGGAIGGILNFITLGLRVMALAAAAALLKEQLHLLKRRMEKDAERAITLSGHLAQAGVDAKFQAGAIEVAAAFGRVAAASEIVADAADRMESSAQGVKDAHDREYGGIYEAVNASPYHQPKPGFNKVS